MNYLGRNPVRNYRVEKPKVPDFTNLGWVEIPFVITG